MTTSSSNKPDAPKSREEIAHAEIGVTDVSTGVKWVLTVFFLAIITIVPIADQWAAYRSTGTVPAAEIVRIPGALLEWSDARKTHGLFDSAAVVNEEMLHRIQTYERDLEDTSALAENLLPTMQNIMVGHLRASSESAYVGRDGWLFFRPDLDYLTGRGFLDPDLLTARARTGGDSEAAIQPDPVRAMVEFRDALAARGIELIVFPVPVKPMIYPEHFSGRYTGDGALQNPSYADLRARLDAAGIRLFDPTDALMDAKRSSSTDLYLATDTHWTPPGLDVTVKALAQSVIETGVIVRADAPRFTRAPAEIRNTGDIGVMLKLPETQSLFTPETVTIAQVSTNDGSPWTPAENAEILLLGDSFSNIFSLDGMGWGSHAGLAEQLSVELNAPLDTILINDAGAYVTREQLSRELKRGHDRLAGKKLVIWEFAMRELAFGDWKLLDYTLGAADAPASDQFTATQVTGTVTAMTHPPRPGSVPYKDCIIAAHVTGTTGEAVVFLWGMRDGEWTDWARLNVGDTVDLPVVPWDNVASRFGSYNRMELADDRLLMLPVFWATSGDEALEPEIMTQTAPETPSPPQPTTALASTLTGIVSTMEAAGSNVWAGTDGWLYLASELRHLSTGPFWGADATAVSRADNAEFADPLPAIVDFSQQLESAGIELILMPVPPKAAIYPEFVAPGFSEPGLGAVLESFYALLREQGVTVLDLTSVYRDLRTNGSELLYCKQDSHWTSAACAAAAKAVAAHIQGRDWLTTDRPIQSSIAVQNMEIEGDLWRMLADAQRPHETVALYRVSDVATSAPIPTHRESPILLLGDSHTLVFSEGADLYEANAGLRDHLAHELKMAVDVVGVRGSGSTPARINLLRRRDNLAGKKVVIWCFTAREFTESASGWRVLPIITASAP